MQKRLLTILCLLIVVGILTTFFILSDKQKADNQKILLSNIEATSISQITIQRTDKGDIVFQKQGNSWFMLSSVEARVNMARINAMLHILQSRSFAQIDVKDSPMTPYQLDPATIVLRLDDHEFFFGTTDPIDERRYVLFGNTIHLINDSLFHQLRQPPIFYVSTRLVPAEETIVSIQFVDQLVTVVGENWALSPVNSAIEDKLLNSLAQAWQTGRAREAWQTGRAREVREYKPVDIFKKIIVTFKNGRTAGFDVVSTTPNLVLGRSDLGLQYHLGKNISEKLFLPDKNIK